MATESDHLRKASRTIELLYKRYKTAIFEFGDDVSVKPVETCIGFLRHDRRFAGFHIYPGHMRIWLVMKPGTLHDVREPAYATQDWYNVKLTRDEGQFEYVLGLIHQAYESKKGVRRNHTHYETPEIAEMAANYSAVIRKDGKWWIGWIQEIRGVNSQESSRAELVDNLTSALREALEQNRAEARNAAGKSFEVASISI